MFLYPINRKTRRALKALGIVIAIANIPGCRTPVRCCTESYVARTSAQVDTTPPPVEATEPHPTAEDQAQADVESEAADNASGGVVRLANQRTYLARKQPIEPPVKPDRFALPDNLPGANVPPLQLPKFDSTQKPAERKSMIEALFSDLQPLSEPVGSAAIVADQAMSLAQLQDLALQQSPVIRQAAAEVERVRGEAIQAGLCPNPVVGYEGDTIGTARTAGYNGVFFNQEIVTAGRLSYAQSRQLMEMRAREHELMRARIELASNVRRGYFNVLVAQEQLKFSRAVLQLSEEVYRAQIQLVTAGEAAPYEPLQLRVFAVQARNQVVRAQNSLDAAWRGLAATLGDPTMPRHILEGPLEVDGPTVNYDQAVTRVSQFHTDLLAAQARISSECYNLKLQQVTPIPNIQLYGAFQHDDTTPLSDFSSNVQVGLPIPVFDRNQGNITAAYAQVVRAQQNLEATRNQLLGTLAEAHNRYDSNRQIAISYRADLLQDQVRVYRGVYERFRAVGQDVDFAQVIVAQQSLGQVITGYLQALNDQWQAAVDLAEVMQVDDFYSLSTEAPVVTVPTGVGTAAN